MLPSKRINLPDFFNDFLDGNFIGRVNAGAPAMNVIEDEKSYKLEVAAPGMCISMSPKTTSWSSRWRRNAKTRTANARRRSARTGNSSEENFHTPSRVRPFRFLKTQTAMPSKHVSSMEYSTCRYQNCRTTRSQQKTRSSK